MGHPTVEANTCAQLYGRKCQLGGAVWDETNCGDKKGEQVVGIG